MANFFEEAGGEAKRIPWWGWLIGAVAVLFFGSHLLSQNSTSGTASADAAGTSGGSGGSVGDIGTPGYLGPPTPAPNPTPTPSPKPNPGTTGTTTYTVKSGDTLNSIASRYHVDEAALYSVNSGTIEATAKSHGFSSGSDHGHWIFPGEVLKIPA